MLDGALSMFFEMRKNEGKKLAEDVEYRLNEIEKLVTFIESRAAAFRQRYFERLHQQMTELLGTVNIDQSRILMEAAIFADKAAVDEETVRLRSHIDQMRGFLTAKEPVGKKMDFLIQEFNDEAILSIEDITPLVRKMAKFRHDGQYKHAEKLLPKERIYPLNDALKKHLAIN